MSISIRSASRPWEAFSAARPAGTPGATRARGRFLIVPLFLTATLLSAGTDTRLADAAEALDRTTVRTLLQYRVGVDAAQVDGMTALLWAAYHNDLELVQLLVGAGADVLAANRYGVTSLSLACTNANAEMVERLLAAGADPNTVLPGGETALMTAARTGSLGAVVALLESGADAHARDNRRGQTALMWAAAEGHVDVVKELIQAGADFRTPLDSGFTPLLFAVREGRMEVVEAFLEAGAYVNEPTPLEPTERQRPLGGGRSIRPGSSPLFVAVTNGHFELAAQLLDAGADPDAAAPGYTVLHMLARVRKPGAGDNNPRPDGSGSMSSLDFVRDIAEHGADMNARMTEKPRLNNTRFDELGATPFLLAALTADAELMRTLAELGADPQLRNDQNSTALMAAAGLGTRSPGEDAGTENEVLEALEVALELGADINAIDDNGETAMHGAAYKNLPEAVGFLAASGAEIEVWNQPNKYGWTPLTIARGYRFGNSIPSLVTIAAVEGILLASGVTPPTEEEENAKAVDLHAKPDYGKRPDKKPPPPL